MKTGWPKVKLSEVLKPVERGEEPVPGTKYRQIGVKLWGKGVYEREPIDGADTKYKMFFRTEEGDVVVNKIWARNGSIAVVNEELAGCYGSGEFPMFAPVRHRLDPRWMHWITKTNDFWGQCDEKSQGTSGKNRIRPERFLEIEIPLPTMVEQQRIVIRIEELATLIQEGQAIRQQVSGEAKALLDANLGEIFRCALKRGNLRLDNASTLERGKFSHRPRNDPRFFGGVHPWIQIGEIEKSNKYIKQWSQTLNDEGLAISKKFPRGTVLISIAATIGTVGILDFDCCIPDSIVGVTPRNGMDSEFIYYYLGYLRRHLEEIAPQSAQKNINLQILSGLPVPKMPLSEQHKIVEELDALYAKVDILKRMQAEATKELDAILPSFLDRALKGGNE
jgi:type I restriction enzyme S subunit